jgi:hypothetical protein
MKKIVYLYMAIFTTQSVGLSMDDFGAATSTPVNIVSPIPTGIEPEFCVKECCYKELVFALPSDPSNEYKNDKREVLINLLSVGSTFSFKLRKSTGEEYDLNDNTYGIFYDVGSFVNQPLKAGYVIDWLLVYNLHGGGQYTLIIEQTDFGQTRTYERWPYHLMIYGDDKADKTVKIHTIHEGVIANKEDYEGITWERWIRIPGFFGEKEPTIESETYESSSRQLIPIRDRILLSYNLYSNMLISEVVNRFLYDLFFASKMYISTYKLTSHEDFIEKEVYPMPSDLTPNYFVNNTKASLDFTLRDIDQNTVKYNI